MEEIFLSMDTRFCQMVANWDIIGWRRFIEGMVCNCLQEIQLTYSAVNGSNVSPVPWTMGVVTKLVEATHGQWLYCCVQIHDRCKGTQAALQKAEWQKEIEDQQEMRYLCLLNEDLCLVFSRG
jgi:hypothetical protein